MGALTVQQIITRVRRQFGDEDSAQIADATFIDYINDAMRDIVLANNLLQVKATVPTVAGTSAYNLPADLLRLHHVSWNGQPLREENIQVVQDNVDQMDNTANFPVGSPETYWIYAGQLNLYPSPGSVANITIYYNRNPTAVVAVGDTPELPARYDNRIIEYCLGKAGELDENPTLYTTKMQEFERGLTKSKDDEELGSQSSYPFISPSIEDTTYY